MLRFQLAAAIIVIAVTAFFGVALADQTGIASWYGKESGSRRADGHRFDPNAVSCAHRMLRLGTWIRVTDLRTRRSIRCQVLDRGPYVAGRIVDLSRGAAKALGMLRSGTARVSISVQSH